MKTRGELDALNMAVSAAISHAEETDTSEAWRICAWLENQLADALPEGPERSIARRGALAATLKAQAAVLREGLEAQQ